MNHSEAGRLGAQKSAETAHARKKERIKKYDFNPNKCAACQRSLSYKKRINKFCSHGCAAVFTNNERRKQMEHHFCLGCGKQLPIKRDYRRRKFCNHKCHTQQRRRIAFEKIDKLGYIPNGIDLINTGKLYLIHTRGHRCECCRRKTWLNKPISLHAHHKNGRSRDNRLRNLQLLCPNCHTQTPNHGSKNKNCDRTWRKKYRNARRAGEV